MPKKYEKPNLTYFIIVICIIVFFYEIFYGLRYGTFGSENFNSALSNLFNDYGFSFQNLLSSRYWVFITSIFFHADPSHLALNMLALFFFGRVIEMELGRKKFLSIFIVSAIVSDLAFLTFSSLTGSLDTVLIGASAAIFGLMGTAMLVKPLEFVFYPYLIPIPLILVAVLYTLYNLASFILVAASIEQSNIAYVAHIGGLIAGMFFGFKEEGRKKGLIILLFLLIIIILTPFLMIIYQYLEMFNYVSVISNYFNK